MKKIIFSIFASLILLTTAYGIEGDRVCETKYSTINGMDYFSGIHCTEDIKITGVLANEDVLRNISQKKINEFIINNNHKIVDHLKGSGSCDDVNELSEVKSFESTIYSNNGVSFTTTTSSIESLGAEVESLEEDYNAEDLYNTTFDTVKNKYPISSIDFLRVATKEAYFEVQLGIKNQILSKQKEKLTLIYKINETQNFIEGFYSQINRTCKNAKLTIEKENLDENNTSTEITDEGSEGKLSLADSLIKKAEEKEALIKKYKEEFNLKLGEKLDSFPKHVLEKISFKLLTYADTSPVFRKFNSKQKELVKLKITALKQAIDDRLN